MAACTNRADWTGAARASGLACALAVGLAAPGLAQEAPPAGGDPIGALLDAPSPEPRAAPVVASPAPPPAAPWIAPTPAPYTAPPPADAAGMKPVFVDEIGRTPDGPPTPTDQTYEARLRASFASAQGLQGPLDGRWTLSAAGEDLYALQLVDAGGAPLEGAWRDVRRAGVVEASGFLSDIQRAGSTLTFQFQPKAGGPVLSAAMTPTADGGWTGELHDGAARRPATMRRN